MKKEEYIYISKYYTMMMKYDYFFINYTIFRNVPLSQLKRLNDKEFKKKKELL